VSKLQTNSSVNRAYCYAELTVSSMLVAVNIASVQCAYPGRDGQVELSWVAAQRRSLIQVLTGLNSE